MEWFNQVDATYRADLRELNELNFARFEAKLDQRLAELRQELAGLRGELHAGMAMLRAELAAQRSDLLKWMFIFWATAVLGLIGLLKL